MGKMAKPRRYGCLLPAQQEAYNRYNERQKRYVDFRGQGLSKAESYRMAGYDNKRAGQSAYILERDTPYMADIIEAICNNNRARELTEQGSSLNKQIDALAKQESVEQMLARIDGADGETSRRIQFYRNIINGTIKTVKKTKKIKTKMKARKELDRILGLQTLPDLGALQVGDITINIVDASKQDELEDDRNKVVLDEGKVEVIDGEKVIVTEEQVEKTKKPSLSEEFNVAVGEDNE